jgi:hypothetical protein
MNGDPLDLDSDRVHEAKARKDAAWRGYLAACDTVTYARMRRDAAHEQFTEAAQALYKERQRSTP